jgi:hypothetical protein
VRAEERAVLGLDVRPSELNALVQATRERAPFLFTRDGAGELRVISLRGERLVLGRAPGSDVEIDWDGRVSGVHAHLERHSGRWVIEDDGLSRNGTRVNGEPLRGQRTLRDGDLVKVGDTLLCLRDPSAPAVAETIAVPTVPAPRVSEAQRRVLVALCRPLEAGEPFALPASNQQIAEALTVSLDAVKGHMRALFQAFAVENLPPHEKRSRLAQRAIEAGVLRAD